MNRSELAGSAVLITGSTGLIGKTLIKKLLDYNHNAKNPVTIIACARNPEKARSVFGSDFSDIYWITGDIREIKPKGISVDYIIHTASQTASKAFVTHPVETISVALDGTRNLLEFARTQNLKRFIYLSSMEVYGVFQTDEKINESYPSHLNTMDVRTCYPESKRMCESLCASYSSEYGIPFNVIRLTQTFGKGVEYQDTRVFAEFARCAIENRDIILKTKGTTKRCYLDVDDAAEAIFTVMLNDWSGEVFNAANEETYCSIYEMACLVAEQICENKIHVQIKEDGTNKSGFAPELHMNLDTTKLSRLGWQAKTGLADMFKKLIDDMERNHK